MLQTHPSPVQDEAVNAVDYKQFIREFESYRNGHPEESFQQALETLLGQPVRVPELVGA